jgi:hypothetical protein
LEERNIAIPNTDLLRVEKLAEYLSQIIQNQTYANVAGDRRALNGCD